MRQGKTINEILKRGWFVGVRADRNLLFFGLRVRGENKFIAKKFGRQFFQNRLLVPTGRSVVRLIDREQARLLHARIRTDVLKNPELLLRAVEDDNALLGRIKERTKKIKTDADFLAVLKMAEEHYFLFFYCFALGVQLFEHRAEANEPDLIDGALRAHDVWRNHVAAKEKWIIGRLAKFARVYVARFGLKRLADLYYIEIGEFEHLIRGKRRGGFRLEKVAARRKKFAAACFNEKNYIFDEPTVVERLQKLTQTTAPEKEQVLRGQIACASAEKITGRVLVVKNPRRVGNVEPGTILVAVQTTPDFISIIKKFAGIITDEGGITSHAAIISREFKIPCIIGTRNATRTLKNGEEVEMDLVCGKVRKLGGRN